MHEYKEKICNFLNSVCNNKATWSCLQCYDETSQKYNTNECSKSCSSEKVRYSYCFKLSEEYILIAEKEDVIVIVTFYPFSISDLRTLSNKCDNIINY